VLPDWKEKTGDVKDFTLLVPNSSERGVTLDKVSLNSLYEKFPRLLQDMIGRYEEAYVKWHFSKSVKRDLRPQGKN